MIQKEIMGKMLFMTLLVMVGSLALFYQFSPVQMESVFGNMNTWQSVVVLSIFLSPFVMIGFVFSRSGSVSFKSPCYMCEGRFYRKKHICIKHTKMKNENPLLFYALNMEERHGFIGRMKIRIKFLLSGEYKKKVSKYRFWSDL